MERRTFLTAGLGAGVALNTISGRAAAATPAAKPYQDGKSRWPLCLNASTIRPTPLEQKIQVAADTGYDAIELWIDDLENHEKAGGSLEELGAHIKELGLFVPNIIGLWSCMPAEEDKWRDSLPATRERMRRAAAAGSHHVAAIPSPDRSDFNIKRGAEQYRELLKIGREEYGIIVAFEFVGFLKGIHRLGQACAIALDANDPDACLIADTFHLFRGGSGFQSIQHLQGDFIADFHFNDVMAEPPREEQGDAHRVYPGDGVLPLTQLLGDLRDIGYTGPLSLELFRKEHYEMDPAVVARTGLEKMLDLVQEV